MQGQVDLAFTDTQPFRPNIAQHLQGLPVALDLLARSQLGLSLNKAENSNIDPFQAALYSMQEQQAAPEFQAVFTNFAAAAKTQQVLDAGVLSELPEDIQNEIRLQRGMSACHVSEAAKHVGNMSNSSRQSEVIPEAHFPALGTEAQDPATSSVWDPTSSAANNATDWLQITKVIKSAAPAAPAAVPPAFAVPTKLVPLEFDEDVLAELPIEIQVTC